MNTGYVDPQGKVATEVPGAGAVQLSLFGDGLASASPGRRRVPILAGQDGDNAPTPPTADAACTEAVSRTVFGSDVAPARSDARLSKAEGVAEADEPMAGAPRNFRELLDRLEGASAKDRKEIETRCAVRRMGEILRRPLQNISTDPVELRRLLRRVTPASEGMSAQRWSRIRSLVAYALREHGLDLQPARDVRGHSPSWKALGALAPDKACRDGMSRFMSFCSRQGIEPVDVTPATFESFRVALDQRSLQAKPEALYRATVRCWNRAREAQSAWPQTKIGLQKHKRFYSLDWADFPRTFQDDVEAYLAQTGCDDVFSPDYRDPSRPSTITLRRREFRQLASLLVMSGFPINEVTGLSVLVRSDNAMAALKQQVARTENSIGSSLGQQAWVLKVVARDWVKDSVAAQALGELAPRLCRKQQAMTDRNAERLRQFDLKANVDALLQLPAKVFSEAEREKVVSPELGRRVMLALAVDMLTVAPLRVRNMTGLELDRHLMTTGRGAAREVRILIPADEAKQGEMIEMRLPVDTVQRMERYLARYRPALYADAAPWLFVSPKGSLRSVISFSRAISNFIKRETGLIMHVHLFRALAAKLHLQMHSEDVETVRRLLGHKRSDTTQRHYIENRTRQSFDKFADMIERHRANMTDAARVPRRGGGR